MTVLKIKYILPICWFGLIAFGSLTSRGGTSIFLFPHFDKLVHFGMYFGLVVLMIPAVLKQKNYIKAYIISASIAIFLGILFEILQLKLTNYRSADIYDALFNTIGAVLATMFYHYFIRNKNLEKSIFRIE